MTNRLICGAPFFKWYQIEFLRNISSSKCNKIRTYQAVRLASFSGNDFVAISLNQLLSLLMTQALKLEKHKKIHKILENTGFHFRNKFERKKKK